MTKHFFKTLLFSFAFVLPLSSVQAAPADDFVFRWEATMPNQTMTFPAGGSYTVDWGDGSTDSTGYSGVSTHEYATPGVYEVRVQGPLTRINFVRMLEALQLRSIEQWGTSPWASMKESFSGAGELVINATDAPDLSKVTTMQAMFYGARKLNQNINHWDVSNVNDMSNLFYNTSFNKPLNSWDTSSVRNMSGMFARTSAFNQDISMWDVSNVSDMKNMFETSEAFNQPLLGWDTSNVIRMGGMFSRTKAFNQPIGYLDFSFVGDYIDLNGSPFSQENYDDLLNSLAQQQFTYELSINTSASYCAENARNQLLANPKVIKIIDNGKAENCSPEQNLPVVVPTVEPITEEEVDMCGAVQLGLETRNYGGGIPVWLFVDVTAADSAYSALARLAEKMIVTGDGDTRKANLGAFVQRDQMAKMISIARKDSIKDAQTCAIDLPFSDTSNTAWYAAYVDNAVQQGLVSGYPDGTFQPAKSITLAETYKIVATGMNYITEEQAKAEAQQQELAWYKPYMKAVHSVTALPAEVTHLPLDAPLTRSDVFLFLDAVLEA